MYDITIAILGVIVSIVALYFYLFKLLGPMSKVTLRQIRFLQLRQRIRRTIRRKNIKPEFEEDLKRAVKESKELFKFPPSKGLKGRLRYLLWSYQELFLPKKRREYIQKLDKAIAILRNSLSKNHNEKGSVALQVLFFLVPALISLTLTESLVYLLIMNKGVSDYKAPESLTKPLSIIIGYYFGVGASSTASKSKET